jgi:hypothetical protein
MNTFSTCEIQKAAIQICQFLSVVGPRESLVNDDDDKTIIISFIDVLHEEKLRIESGKRTAVQRKLTKRGREEEIALVSQLFTSLVKLKHSVSANKNKRIVNITEEDNQETSKEGVRKKRRVQQREAQQKEKDIQYRTNPQRRCKEITNRGKRCKLPPMNEITEFCSKHI